MTRLRRNVELLAIRAVSRKRLRRQSSVRRLRLETLETRSLLAGLPYGAMPDDTGEYMLGRIAVTPVLLESDGTMDTSTEDWTPSHKAEVRAKIDTALQWWQDTLAALTNVHQLDFVVDDTFVSNPVSTKYEPISRVSNDYQFWVTEFLVGQGFQQSTNLEKNMRAFNHSQRVKFDADWAFTMFIVNSENDSDGQFQSGGSFRRAFSFAGGLFMVVPSTRPTSTYTHEIGHQFWARDEYVGGGNFEQRRGYYNTQNLNALDLNPTQNFQQAPSIMSDGQSLEIAYATNTSAASTLAMIGWQDSDGDGVFDVLDVPLQLTGTGRFESVSRMYVFQGRAAVGTLPNRNSSGLQNDITINRISRIEVSYDNANWTSVATPNTFTAELSLTIPVPLETSEQIFIRAIDAKTGITSNIFSGTLSAKPSSIIHSGIDGFVWLDSNQDQIWQDSENGRPGWVIQIVNSHGNPVQLQTSVEPDDRPVGMIASNAFAGVTLSAVGDDAGGIGVAEDSFASTGTKVFRPYSNFRQDFNEGWDGTFYSMRADFQQPTSYVQVDVIGLSPESYGRLEVYDASGVMIGRATSSKLVPGANETLQIGVNSNSISYAIVKGHVGSTIRIDNLKFGPSASASTDTNGYFSLPYLAEGSYIIQATAPWSGFQFVGGTGRNIVDVLASAPSTTEFAVFGQTSIWQNPVSREDVDQSGTVTPRDVLIVISTINARGSGSLEGFSSPPFVDVDGNGSLSPRDVLSVISFINSRTSGNGEGEAGQTALGLNFGGESSRQSVVPLDHFWAEFSDWDPDSLQRRFKWPVR